MRNKKRVLRDETDSENDVDTLCSFGKCNHVRATKWMCCGVCGGWWHCMLSPVVTALINFLHDFILFLHSSLTVVPRRIMFSFHLYITALNTFCSIVLWAFLLVPVVYIWLVNSSTDY